MGAEDSCGWLRAARTKERRLEMLFSLKMGPFSPQGRGRGAKVVVQR